MLLRLSGLRIAVFIVFNPVILLAFIVNLNSNLIT